MRHAAAARVRVRTLAVALLAFAGATALAGSPAQAAPVPAVSTGGVSNVTYSSAILHGHVNAERQPTNYYFQYGPTRKYGATTPLSPGGNASSSVPVSQAISGLQPLSTYHYRLVAVDAAGAQVGADESFSTPKIPLSVAIVGVPNPVPFGGLFIVEGTLSGTGNAAHPVMLQANPFPYLTGFQPLGNAELTSATGGFSFPVPGLLQNTQLRVVTLGNPTVVSPVIVEGVAVKVTLHVHSTRRRGYARLYGTVTPAEVGALVGFQLLKTGHRSTNVGGTVVKAASATVSSFSRTVRVRRGLYQALIQVHDGAHVSAYSPPVLIR